MKLMQRLMLTGIFTVLFVGPASALNYTLSLDNVTIVGGILPTSQTYMPTLPIIGNGVLFQPTGKFLELPDYSIIIDVNLDGDDARLDITNWRQDITNINIAGFITSTGSGSTACTDLGGGFGALVCQNSPMGVGGWSGADPAVAPSARLTGDSLGGTIVVTDSTNAAAGTVTQFYSYSIVPEPGTGSLLALGLAGFGFVRRRGRK
jgi:hypothetical protein